MKIYTKKLLEKFDNPAFAIIYYKDDCHPQDEVPRPAWTHVYENWQMSQEIKHIIRLCGFGSHFKTESKVFDASVFDWNEINEYMLHKYYHEDKWGNKKIKIKNLAIYNDLI